MTEPTYLSEISLLQIAEPNLMGFRLTGDVDRETGNRLSYQFSARIPDVVVIWRDGYFWALGKRGVSLPVQDRWREELSRIQEDIEEFRSRYWSFQWLQNPTPSPEVISGLASGILQKERCLSSRLVEEKQRARVEREAKFWAETVELNGEIKPAIALSVKSRILYKGTLEDFYEDHPERQDPEKVLVGLKVIDIEKGSGATIVGIVGRIGEGDNRVRLAQYATGSLSLYALEEAPDDQPIVAIKFKSSKTYNYALAALRPMITAETANAFGVKYGDLLKASKISFLQRKELVGNYKLEMISALEPYGYKVEKASINSITEKVLFKKPSLGLSETLLLFGKGKTAKSGSILSGLKEGGVFKRHENYQDRSKPIEMVILNLCDRAVNGFINEVQKQLAVYEFSSEIVDNIQLSVDDNNYSRTWANIEERINEALSYNPEIFLVFLPQSDRQADSKNEGSLYNRIYSHLLYRRVASQFIYEDTLQQNQRFVLNQIIPGILAKLGNLPFVLAKPLEIADSFIGFDISRQSKANLPGTLNVCASIRLYGKRGEFIRYQLESDFVQGEEIPQRFIEKVLPVDLFKNKTVLLYRDGRFVNQEIEKILKRADALNARFILVECRKSQIPRLYNFVDRNLAPPTRGLTLQLSSREAIVVTTQVAPNVGLARPLRLNVRPEGYQASIESVVDATLKLTLLHHGALKPPRLPMPLYGADRMADLRLKGIYPSALEGDRQFWL
ncbi:Piwi domain-containing protein [Pannus brasiliensis CCIBt3594]|uniref:Protein argonaute n=1 Tax=Pannus brasiliensis CCIBt3594 TaxID=1427578 RepID=A0AAW9QPP8_9CHRO